MVASLKTAEATVNAMLSLTRSTVILIVVFALIVFFLVMTYKVCFNPSHHHKLEDLGNL